MTLVAALPCLVLAVLIFLVAACLLGTLTLTEMVHIILTGILVLLGRSRVLLVLRLAGITFDLLLLVLSLRRRSVKVLTVATLIVHVAFLANLMPHPLIHLS